MISFNGTVEQRRKLKPVRTCVVGNTTRIPVVVCVVTGDIAGVSLKDNRFTKYKRRERFDY